MSKIQIESNSQRPFSGDTCGICCIYHVKDTNRKQFTTYLVWQVLQVVLYLSCQRYKSKAIHNRNHFQCSDFHAVFIMSKIQIESNSQLTLGGFAIAIGCIYHVKDTNRKQFTTAPSPCSHNVPLYLSCQRYKSKAIHNITKALVKGCEAVFIMSKIQIESNSQQTVMCRFFGCRCIYHVKDTNRKQFTTDEQVRERMLALYLSCQRYKSKAIHNRIRRGC